MHTVLVNFDTTLKYSRSQPNFIVVSKLTQQRMPARLEWETLSLWQNWFFKHLPSDIRMFCFHEIDFATWTSNFFKSVFCYNVRILWYYEWDSLTLMSPGLRRRRGRLVWRPLDWEGWGADWSDAPWVEKDEGQIGLTPPGLRRRRGRLVWRPLDWEGGGVGWSDPPPPELGRMRSPLAVHLNIATLYTTPCSHKSAQSPWFQRSGLFPVRTLFSKSVQNTFTFQCPFLKTSGILSLCYFLPVLCWTNCRL